MSTNQKATSDYHPSSSRSRSSGPPRGATPAATTGVVLRRDVCHAVAPPPWDVVEAYVRTGAHGDSIDAYADTDPTFAAVLATRLHIERPPWEWVERHLKGDVPDPWVDWYAHASPAFATLIELRRSGAQPPWEVVDEYLYTGDYRAWVEEHAGRSRAFAEVLAAMASPDDEPEDDSNADGAPPSLGRVIPLRPGPRRSSP